MKPLLLYVRFRYMNTLLPLLAIAPVFGQTIDTVYVSPRPYKLILAPFIANKSVELRTGNVEYKPNNPLTVGVAFSIKRISLNARLGYGVFDLRGMNYGKSKSLDLQAHQYGRKFLLDVFVQRYKGFYIDHNTLALYPDMMVRQIGAEITYLLHGDQYSAQAAFLQSEGQRRSAGSFTIGGGVYDYRLILGNGTADSPRAIIDNLQFGGNGGYGYSHVVNSHWLLSGMATAGANLGNSPQLLRKAEVKVYPTAFARGSATYHSADWALSFTFLINNKTLYSGYNNTISITSLNMQLAYVKRFTSNTN